MLNVSSLAAGSITRAAGPPWAAAAGRSGDGPAVAGAGAHIPPASTMTTAAVRALTGRHPG